VKVHQQRCYVVVLASVCWQARSRVYERLHTVQFTLW